MRRYPAEFALIVLFVAGLLLPMARRGRQAEVPRVPTTLAAVWQFPHDFDAYWNDAFGFREQLIRLHARSMLAFGVNSRNDVVRGRDGWLFCTGDHALEIHHGARPMSQNELFAWQHELEARAEWMAARGGHYVVIIAPNKESIYGEMLAEGYEKRGATRLDQLILHMSAHSRVKILDLRGALLAEKTRRQVYARTDTHWNDDGAYVAYREISQHLEELYPHTRARPRDTFTERALPPRSGDLVQKLGMAGFLDEPRNELVPNTEYASGSPQGPRAVVFHDSFFLPPRQSAFRMVALLAEHFSSSVFTYSHEFDPELVERQNATLVIQEMFEGVLSGPPPGHATAM